MFGISSDSCMPPSLIPLSFILHFSLMLLHSPPSFCPHSSLSLCSVTHLTSIHHTPMLSPSFFASLILQLYSVFILLSFSFFSHSPLPMWSVNLPIFHPLFFFFILHIITKSDVMERSTDSKYYALKNCSIWTVNTATTTVLTTEINLINDHSLTNNHT